jgi:hypothetical protein
MEDLEGQPPTQLLQARALVVVLEDSEALLLAPKREAVVLDSENKYSM